ncbi:MAG TPA: M28 family peptidase [Pyrinomonadaceae bacterium]|nr:M28 family peptidase [Pyrinomonadaceae bacterium]HMP65780.1 M28 family peptidase [Pyrinomonadaceae bacterium]
MKHRIMYHLFISALYVAILAVLNTAAYAQFVYSPADIDDVISKMTSAETNEERGAAIRRELSKLNIRIATEGFSQKTRTGQTVAGTNIIAEVPSKDAKWTLLIGAHYDKVSQGEGAIDNASGSAAVIALLKAFRADPPKTFRFLAAFWDQEEVGLVGSRTYVQNRMEGGLPQIYINFDVFGHGDTIWLWAYNEDSEFARSFSANATRLERPFLISTIYPPSDHRSFMVPGVETFSFSLGPSGEAKNIIRVLQGQQVAQEDFPGVLRLIHTPEDKKDKVDAIAMAKALPAIEMAIRALDK